MEKLSVGDIVTLRSGKPFKMYGDLFKLNPVYLLKIREIEAEKIWLEFKVGWIERSKLRKVEIQ